MVLLITPTWLIVDPLNTWTQVKGEGTYQCFHSAIHINTGWLRLIQVNDKPKNHRKTESNLITRVENVRDNPKNSMDKTVPTIPNKRTGFLPMRSDVRLHWNTVIASVAKITIPTMNGTRSQLVLASSFLTQKRNKLNYKPSVIPDLLFISTSNVKLPHKLFYEIISKMVQTKNKM
jgi:hypothetical protein